MAVLMTYTTLIEKDGVPVKWKGKSKLKKH